MTRPSRQDNDDQDDIKRDDDRDGSFDLNCEPKELDCEDEATQKQAADLFLVDALLASMSDRAADERENRIRTVMSAVRETAVVRPRKTHIARWLTVATVAASFLAVITLFSIQSARLTLANEVLSAVNKASSTSTDRVYSIRRVLPSTGDDDLPRGTLYLRGREGFVVTWSDAVLGRSGDQFWLVDSGKHVTVADNFDWIDAESSRDQFGVSILQELSLRSPHVPLMQLASVAELMQCDYEVDLRRVELDGRVVDLLVGDRRSAASSLPTNIRLWADVRSRIIRRAELVWGHGNAIFLELMSGEPVPREWYGYAALCR